MRILVLGANGMLGHKVAQVFSSTFDVYGSVRGTVLSYADLPPFEKVKLVGGLDLSDFNALRELIVAIRPNVVVNAIGVIKQKHETLDSSRMALINSSLPRAVADISAMVGARFLGISTDCVFRGTIGRYTETSTPDADDEYGITKLAGEIVDGNALTIRTSIVGRELTGSHGLLEWFLSHRGGRVKGFRKAIFSGFPTFVLAELLRRVIIDFPDLKGLYHVSSDPISKFDLLGMVNTSFGCGTSIEADDDLRIDRSLDSSRFRKATGFEPEPWAEMVDQMAIDAKSYDEWRKR